MLSKEKPPASSPALIEAAKAANAFLRSVEWNDGASEDHAYDIRRQLDEAIGEAEASLTSSPTRPNSKSWNR